MRKNVYKRAAAFVTAAAMLAGCASGAAPAGTAAGTTAAPAAGAAAGTAAAGAAASETTAAAAETTAAAETEAAQPASDAETDAEEAASAAEKNCGGGKPWIDSCIPENIWDDMELSPKDDFYLYVNHDWANAKRKGENTGKSISERIAEELREIMLDDHAENHAGELLQGYYHAFTDWDARNEAGIEPLRAVAEDICSLNSLEELSAFLADESRSGDVPMALKMNNFLDPDDPLQYVVDLNIQGYADLLLQDPDEYESRSEEAEETYRKVREEVFRDMERLGFSEAEAKKSFDEFFEIETLLSKEMVSLATMLSGHFNQVYEFVPLAELKTWMKEYPIAEILASRGFGAEERILYDNAPYIRLLGDLYTPENFEKFRSYYLVRYLFNNDWACDEEAYTVHMESFGQEDMTEREKDYKMVFDLLNENLPNALDQAYLGRYDASKEREEILALFEEIRAVYHEMLAEEDWLSEETRAKVLEKVDTMKVYALYPDHQIDYSGLDFKGKGFAEIVRDVAQFRRNQEKLLAGTRVDPEADAWKAWGMLEPNAKMMPEKNTFLITLGMLKEAEYSSGMGTEELYAAVGHVIAHEMSHDFDRNGMTFDKDGMRCGTNAAGGSFGREALWSGEEKAEFERRLEKLQKYYDNIVPFEGYHCSGAVNEVEATADLTGLGAIMKLAERQPDFDYDRFFRRYAEGWQYMSTYESQLRDLTNDPHPLNYLRCNVMLQQFDKFLETYDVQPGDNMYLAPEDRIFVW